MTLVFGLKMAKKFSGLGEEYDNYVLNAMKEIASAMIKYMESDTVIPIDTHNLKDALGIGIYMNGTLSEFYMPSKAVVPRMDIGTIGGVTYGALWGKDAIAELIALGMTKYANGCNLVLFSAMPYDFIQDISGVNKGWFTQHLSSEFTELVDEILLKFGLL